MLIKTLILEDFVNPKSSGVELIIKRDNDAEYTIDGIIKDIKNGLLTIEVPDDSNINVDTCKVRFKRQ